MYPPHIRVADLTAAQLSDEQILINAIEAVDHRLKLQGLDPNCYYEINQKECRYGDDLEQIGLILGGNYIGRQNEYWQREIPGDFSSQIFYLKEKNE